MEIAELRKGVANLEATIRQQVRLFETLNGVKVTYIEVGHQCIMNNGFVSDDEQATIKVHVEI